MRFARSLAIALAALTTTPALASPAGIWEIEMRDSRYRVTECGDNQFCAELIWLGNGADNAENLPYLNTMLIDHAQQTRPNQWKGELNLYGHRAVGTVTMVTPKHFTLKGCVAFVICRNYQMYKLAEL